jgi:hypothetical protein
MPPKKVKKGKKSTKKKSKETIKPLPKSAILEGFIQFE